MGRRLIDLTGKTFGTLTVLKRGENRNERKHTVYWTCKCQCGNIVNVCGDKLKNQKTCSHSCKCNIGKEMITKSGRKIIKHGFSNTRLHKIWRDMICRCYSKNNYHGEWYRERGITICDEWKNDFIKFYNWAVENGYNDNLTIERINNNKGYSPDNCKWETMLEQCHNKGLSKLNKSGVSGVTKRKDSGKWRVSITNNYEKINIGTFSDFNDAVFARKEAERIYWGKGGD